MSKLLFPFIELIEWLAAKAA